MDMQQIGYFLYMEEQENRRKEQDEKVNVELKTVLAEEQATQNENDK